MHQQKTFYCGTQYFRPPNPPRDQHRFHLEKIKNELGFNIIKLFWLWNSSQRAPGAFDFSEYEEVLEICDELELNVLVNTCLEDAPYWLERAHPECRYVNAKGQAAELSGNDNHPSGGHPGLCFDNPVVMKEAEKFLAALVSCVTAHPSFLGYDCWNEPHIEPNWKTLYWADQGDLLYCYCPASLEKFRHWLRDRYGTVEALNAAWVRYYGDWEEVNPPRRHGNFADWLDWWRFWFDNLQAQMKWRYETLKQADPDHFVMSHSGGVPPIMPRIEAGINNFALAKEVDLWGTSLAPMSQNWSSAEAAAVLQVTRSAARGKEYWVSEMQAGYTTKFGLYKAPRPRSQDIRNWNWLAAAYGTTGIMYWCYLTESTGNEAQGFGLVRFNGETTERALEAARNARLLRHYEGILTTHVPAGDVAILYEPDSSTIMFAQEGHDQWVCGSHVAYSRTVWDADLYGRWINFEDLHSVPENVLIIPMHYVMTEEAAGHLRRYVENGGTLIAENSLGLYDSNGRLQPQVPPFGLAEVFGLEEEENYFTWPGYGSQSTEFRSNVGPSFFGGFVGPYNQEVYCAPEIAMSAPTETRFRTHGFLTPLRLTTAESLGGWNEFCLAARNRFGRGEAYYFGTFVGLAMFHGENGAATAIGSILADKLKAEVRGKNLRPRLIGGDDEALLCIFNDSRFETHTELITIPPRYTQAVDIHTDDPVAVRNAEVEVTVAREDVKVLYLCQG